MTREPETSFRTPPAPVVSDEGIWGRLPPLPEERARAARPRSRVRRAAAQFALVTTIWVLALGAMQASTRAAAMPSLERIVATLTDIDGLLALQEPTVRADAAPANAPSTIAVPGFPIPAATLTREDAQRGRRDEWRATLLSRGASALYDGGMTAFAQEARGTDGGILSTSIYTAWLIEALTASRHTLATIVSAVLGLGMLAMAARVVRLGEGASRFVVIGLALVAAAALASTLSLLTMAACFVAGIVGGGQLSTEAAAVARSMASAPLREAAPLAAVGALLALVSAGVAIWLTRMDPEGYDGIEVPDEDARWWDER